VSALQYDCSMSFETSAAKIDEIQARLLPLLKACEASLFRSIECDVFWSTAEILLMHQHSRACAVEQFRQDTISVLYDGPFSKKDLQQLAATTSAAFSQGAPNLAQNLLESWTHFIATIKDELEPSLLNDLLDETRFWDDAERATDTAYLKSLLDSSYSDIESTWQNFISASTSEVGNVLSSGDSSTLENRIMSELDTLEADLTTAFSSVLGRANQVLFSARELWMEFSLARKNQRPAFVQFAYPDSPADEQGNVLPGYLPQILEHLNYKKEHLQALSYSISQTFTDQYNQAVSASSSASYPLAWIKAATAYEALINSIS